MKTILPKALTSGSTVGIVALSNPYNDSQEGELHGFRSYMSSIGVETVLGEHFYDSLPDQIAAGSAENRAADFNSMVADPSIDAIRVFQGGQLVSQILKYIDFDALKQNPKCIFGKSDIDLLPCYLC